MREKHRVVENGTRRESERHTQTDRQTDGQIDNIVRKKERETDRIKKRNIVKERISLSLSLSLPLSLSLSLSLPVSLSPSLASRISVTCDVQRLLTVMGFDRERSTRVHADDKPTNENRQRRRVINLQCGKTLNPDASDKRLARRDHASRHRLTYFLLFFRTIQRRSLASTARESPACE